MYWEIIHFFILTLSLENVTVKVINNKYLKIRVKLAILTLKKNLILYCVQHFVYCEIHEYNYIYYFVVEVCYNYIFFQLKSFYDT